MIWIALKMLFGSRGKFVAMCLGVAIASSLIAQQCSIFCGVMLQTASVVRDVSDAAIWVMDPDVAFVDDYKGLPESQLLRVQSTVGVAWAVPRTCILVEARTPRGTSGTLLLIGLDDQSFVGAPRRIIAGSIEDLDVPDAIVIDDDTYRKLWPSEPIRVGKVLEISDRRAVIVAVCRASPTYEVFPIVYSKYTDAKRHRPNLRIAMTYVLATPEPGRSLEEVRRAIQAETGLLALSKQQFVWKTMRHYLTTTGAMANFAVTVLVGFLVGTVIAGLTFYQFTIENLPHFGVMKAMGASDSHLVEMVLAQAISVGAIGYGLGVGTAALFGEVVKRVSRVAYYMPWQVLVATGVSVLLIISLCSWISIRHVFEVEPAIAMRK